jgi:hypothetical protein
MAGPSVPPPAPRWSGSTWLEGLLVAAWLVGCDTWVKLTARVAACSSTPSVREAWDQRWLVPAGCGEADFWGIARLSPVVRDAGPFGLPGPAAGWAYALLALAAVVSVLVLRWRWRTTGDALALGTIWGAAVILAAPALAGTGTAELQLGQAGAGGLATGLGDLALVWALGWLGWRAIAEMRA